MAGLQGVGKTTVCGKLALALTKQSKKVQLMAHHVPLRGCHLWLHFVLGVLCASLFFQSVGSVMLA